MLLNISKPICTFLVLACATLSIKAQQSIQTDNVKFMDSLELNTKLNFCHGILEYFSSYTKKKLEEDRTIIYFLNKLYDDSVTERVFDNESKKIKRSGVYKEQRINGIIKVVSLTLNGNYIKAEVNLELIDRNIFRKSYVINSLTKSECGDVKFRIFDFNLFKEHLLQDINFNITFQNNAIGSERFNRKNLTLSSFNYPSYKFNIPNVDSASSINQIFYNQYNNDSSCYYSYLKPERHFLDLIKKDEIGIIKELLYSPNYIYSVQAMESVIYLSSVDKVVIDYAMQNQIQKIKNADYEITIQKTYDLFTTVDGYKQINTTDDAVIKKFRNSCKQRNSEK